MRVIARAVGLPPTTVYRVIREYRAAQQQQHDLDHEVASEARALLAKYEAAGVGAKDFDVADADPVLVARLVASGVDITDEESVAVMAALTKDPGDELARWRIGSLPRTAEWWEGRNKLGQLLTERAVTDAKIAAGWRYHDFAWHSMESC